MLRRTEIAVLARWVTLAVALAMACSAPESSTTLPTFPTQDSRPPLVVTPDDLLSDVGVTPISIKVAHGLVSQDTLSAIATAARLRTYPELTDVAVTTKTHVADPYPTGPDFENYVTVTPTQPLDATRWYVLTVVSVPSTVRPPTSGPLRKEPPMYGSRFRVGSAPVIRQVEAHADGSTIVSFSEGIAVNGATLPTLLAANNPDTTPCAYTPPGGNVPPPSAQSGVAFKCDPSVASQKRVSLDLKPGLVAMSNEPVGWLDPTATSSATLTKTAGGFVVDLSDSCGKDCFSWRP